MHEEKTAGALVVDSEPQCSATEHASGHVGHAVEAKPAIAGSCLSLEHGIAVGAPAHLSAVAPWVEKPKVAQGALAVDRIDHAVAAGEDLIKIGPVHAGQRGRRHG